jgi:hypothetical protein
MSKAKTNALDALRALIAERQQYEQWISTLEAKREGTPEHVFERVHNDYRGRLDRVVNEIRGHAEELQLSISTLSARLVEVARDEDSRREGLQEAELRAAVGEYEPAQWEEIKSEAESALEKIAADRVSLDSQLSELRAIQKLARYRLLQSQRTSLSKREVLQLSPLHGLRSVMLFRRWLRRVLRGRRATDQAQRRRRHVSNRLRTLLQRRRQRPHPRLCHWSRLRRRHRLQLERPRSRDR